MYPVWDYPVRLIHWYFPVAILFMWWSGEQGHMVWHSWIGYSLIVAVVTRILWGFAGSFHARFSSFLKGPGAVLGYLRGRPFDGPGHNPLGGWSSLLLLVLVLVQGTTGLFSADDLAFEGPFAYWVGDASPTFGELHEINWTLLSVVILIHIAAIAFYVFRKRQPLIRAMWFGQAEGKMSAHPPRPALVAFGIALTLAGLLYLLISMAPVAPSYY